MTTRVVEKQRLESLYARLGPAIYARCNRLLKDPAAAEDATQDVFLKVLKHIESAPNEAAVLPWIHRITTNHCFNILRDSRRRAEPVEQVPEQKDEDFEVSVVEKNFADRVMMLTPQEERASVVLYHLKGMEQADVAAALGVSRRTILYRLTSFNERAQRLNKLAESGAC